MIHRLNTQADVDAAIKLLVRQDQRLAAVVAKAGQTPLRRRASGFAGLASIIVAQQVSTASAAAIWGRLAAAFEPFDAQKIRRCRTTTLQRVGLSAPKIKAIKAIATAVADGLDLEALAERPADEAHATLTQLHGVGPWTADIYLLFCLGHADAWPAGDLALQEAVKIAFGHEARPNTKAMGPLAEVWRPWRGVAACLLWSYYRAVKQRDGVTAS
jgi:DNA-3-methyladenine glycosylase II